MTPEPCKPASPAARPAAVTRLRARVAGVSMVELMVALAVGMLLIAGILQLLVSSRQSYTLNEVVSRVQENGRFAITALADQARSARTLGCRSVRLEEVEETLQVQACDLLQDPTLCSTGGDHVVNAETAIGFDDADYSEGGDWLDPLPGDASTGAEAAVRDHWLRGDILVTWGTLGVGTYVQLGDATNNPLQDDLSGTVNLVDPNEDLKGGRIALITDCEGTDLFTISNPTTSAGGSSLPEPTNLEHALTFKANRVNTGVSLSRHYNRVGTGAVPGTRIRARVFPFDYRIFFVCCVDASKIGSGDGSISARAGGASKCDDATKADIFRPALCRWDPIDATQQLVPEVADMQITYDGELPRTDGERSSTVTRFSDMTSSVPTASWVTANGYWAEVHSANVELLVTGVESVKRVDSAPNPDASAAGDLGYGLASDRRYYQPFSTVIALRVRAPWWVEGP